MTEVLERRYPEGIPPYLAAVVSAEDQARADERLPHLSRIRGTRVIALETRCAVDIRDEASARGLPFFVKQLGMSHKDPARELDGWAWDEFPKGFEKRANRIPVSIWTQKSPSALLHAIPFRVSPLNMITWRPASESGTRIGDSFASVSGISSLTGDGRFRVVDRNIHPPDRSRSREVRSDDDASMDVIHLVPAGRRHACSIVRKGDKN